MALSTAYTYHLFEKFDFAPGATKTTYWNNIPEGKAYVVSAFPYWSGDYYEGYTNTTELEVTRVWLRRRQVQSEGSIGYNVDVHNDIGFEVKNVGGHKCNYNVYLAVFT